MKRRLIILIVSFVLMVGLSIGGFLIVQGSPKLQNSVAKLANVSTTTNATVVKNTVVQNKDPMHIADLRSVAKIFAERYGSTSNQNPGGLRSVLPYTSDRLSSILSINIANQESLAIPETAIITETTAFVVVPANVSIASATVTVSTVRRETVGATPGKQKKQDLILECVREKNAWVIDQARWGDASEYGN